MKLNLKYNFSRFLFAVTFVSCGLTQLFGVAEQGKSFSVDHLTLKKAIDGTDVECEGPWNWVNPAQEFFNKNSLSLDDKFFSQFNDKELAVKISRQYEEINKFIKDNGFDIQVKSFDPRESFAVAAILKLAFEWAKKGKKDIFSFDNKEYEAVFMKNAAGYDVYAPSCHVHKVMELKTKDGKDSVFMTEMDPTQPLVTQEDLVEKINAMNNDINLKNNVTAEYKIKFPKINFNQEADISWMLRASRKDKQSDLMYKITQARQQTKLQIDENGGKVESCTVIVMTKESSMYPPADTRKLLAIEKPFLVWIKRNGELLPVYFKLDSDSFVAKA